MLTRAQKRAVEMLKERGGAAYMGDIPTFTFNLSNYMKTIGAFYGKEEMEKLRAAHKANGIKGKSVWCSNRTLSNLHLKGIIEPITEVPGAWRLSNHEV